ncbi:MAG: peroxiredoxin family protein [Mycobacteriales bacterium]
MRRDIVRFGVVAAVTAVLVVVGVTAFRGSSSAGASTDPASFALPRLDGSGQVRLADFRGRPTVVNFFASWCTACDAELPAFAQRARELKGKVDFVGVDSLETGDKHLLVRRYHLDRAFAALASDVGGSKRDGLHAALGGGNRMPLTAFFDESGALVHVERSALVDGDLDRVLSAFFPSVVARS